MTAQLQTLPTITNKKVVKPNHMKIVEPKQIAIENTGKTDEAFDYSANFEVRFTKDPMVLSQYYILREKCFREVDDEYRARHPEDCVYWSDYDGSENIDDKRGKILVALHNGKVVAGMRFLLCDWTDYTLNEVPEAKFTHREFLKTVGLDHNATYAEIDDILIDENFRSQGLIEKMFNTLIEESKRYNCKYLIGIAVKVSCRNDRRVFHRLGYKFDIFLKYPWLKQRNHGYETRYPVIAYTDQRLS